MAAWLGFRAEESEAEDEAGLWRYDSTWEDDEEEDEDGGGGGGDGDEGGEPEGAEAAADSEPEDAGEQLVRSSRQQEQRSNSSPLSQRGSQFSGVRNWNAARDLQRYRHRYPGLIESENEEEEEMWNLSFYKNEISFLPQGLHIEILLESWWDNYEVLEENHSYIQWLFPLREHGMNWRAKPLTCQEIQAFKKSQEVMQRFIRAYQLMLRFYGINLINEETGELKRAENWAERFQNLNRFSHNNLRITRILKCLGEMGYEHYQVHLVKFFLTETLVKETLPNVKRSALDYFLFTVRSKRKRRELVYYAWQHYKPRGSFVWGPHEKLSKYRPRSAKSQLHQKAGDKQEPSAKNCNDSVEEDQNQPLEEEQKAGDAAGLQPKANDEDVKGKLSECVSKGEDGEEEKEASCAQQEEKDLNSTTEEVQDTAENDCTKESKKRKLDATMADAMKTGPSKSPTDIENISRNLGECAIDAETPSSGPSLQAEEDQKPLKKDDASTKTSAVPETTDAVVKRRKVDKRTSKSKTYNLAINLNMRSSASSAELNPSVVDNDAEKENVGEKNSAVEASSEKGGGDADDGAAGPQLGSRLPEMGRTSPVSDGLELSGDQDAARSDQHPNSTEKGKREGDGAEQHKKAENANGKKQAEVTGKKQVPESLEQSVAATCPEEDSAEVAPERPGSPEPVAGPGEEQVAAE
ncbi:opioid growth factor receptor isoform B [Patagioenas fasciata monilis]|uniref:Opioid growth factor receptor isoform B n=1 Tax=Patagioenas fasciata monilis TaxID=372326 RepID=A0A1V4KKD5_PATFA|nr:opioid growth factor receptor isoform B [Patagioenas fasciata monilis]